MDLYGFSSQEELKMFELLISVSGVGAKGAIGVLSALTPSKLAVSLVTNDVASIKKASGIGPKTAQRIILELKVDSSPENAIAQIEKKGYILRFKGKLGEKPKYTGKVLAVGISYNRKTKLHSCKIKSLE